MTARCASAGSGSRRACRTTSPGAVGGAIEWDPQALAELKRRRWVARPRLARGGALPADGRAGGDRPGEGPGPGSGRPVGAGPVEDGAGHARPWSGPAHPSGPSGAPADPETPWSLTCHASRDSHGGMNSGVGRIFARGIVGVLSLVLVSTLVPVTAAQAKSHPVVPMELFGVHYHGISNSQPNFRVGAIRLWDSGVTWARAEPRAGRLRVGASGPGRRQRPQRRGAGGPVRLRRHASVGCRQARAQGLLRARGVVPAGGHGLLHGLRDCHGRSGTRVGSPPTRSGTRAR